MSITDWLYQFKDSLLWYLVTKFSVQFDLQEYQKPDLDSQNYLSWKDLKDLFNPPAMDRDLSTRPDLDRLNGPESPILEICVKIFLEGFIVDSEAHNSKKCFVGL